jgi:hypothetical protein
MKSQNTFADMQNTEYPAKVIIAWGEAIKGNKAIREWLMENGYPELGIFVHALHNQDEARNWLLTNGFPHLMALINGAEGNPNAILWLRKHGYTILEKMAQAGDNREESYLWLLNHGHQDFAMVANRIRQVKNEIDENNNDMHRMSGV